MWKHNTFVYKTRKKDFYIYVLSCALLLLLSNRPRYSWHETTDALSHCFWSRGKARCRPEGHSFFFFFLMSKLSRIFGRIRLQLCSWNRLVSGTLPGRNCFCETLLLSLQTQRGKCSFIDRLHPHTCTVTVLPLWLGYKSIRISVSFLCAQRMHQICMLNIKLIALFKVLPGLRHGFETWCTMNTEMEIICSRGWTQCECEAWAVVCGDI